MLRKGYDFLGNVISEAERAELINIVENGGLSDESGNPLYGVSKGNQLELNNFYKKLTPIVKAKTGLKLKKQNAYGRIYENGGKLGKHTDREGLDVTLSIQLECTLDSPSPIFVEAYDKSLVKVCLGDRSGVVIKGREIPHWRDEIVTSTGRLVCVFFHWSVVGLEYEEIENFLSDAECDNVINGNNIFGESMVLINGVRAIEPNIRDNKVCFYPSKVIDDRLRNLVGNMQLEGLQLLKYDNGNKFHKHHDDKIDGHTRLYTAVIYLNDDCIGGETHFPEVGLTIKPKKGKLLLFKNIVDGVLNPKSLHESYQIKKGTKHALVNWVWID